MMQPQANEIRSLTGLRGLAAVYVMLFHYSTYSGSLSYLKNIIGHGYLAVDLFFILSGFVMALTYAQNFSNGIKEAYSHFLLRRLARVYPLYACVMIVTIGMTVFVSSQINYYKVPLDMPHILSHFLMIQSWGISNSYLGPAWSISAEWAAYLLFPVLLSVSVSANKYIALLSGGICVAILYILSIGGVGQGYNGALDVSDGSTLAPLLRCLSEFTLGLLTFRIWKQAEGIKYIQNSLSTMIIILLIMVLAALKDTDIFIVLLFPPLLLSLSTNTTLIACAMGGGVIYGLGVISYSLYMLHIIGDWFQIELQQFCENMAIPHAYAASIALKIIIALLLAIISYFAIERPARNLAKKLIK